MYVPYKTSDNIMAPGSSLLSSPDPLALSQLSASPTKPSPKKKAPRDPLAEASGNKQIQDFYLATPPKRNSLSPTKSLALADDATSPWRIRVTVEAERDDLKGNNLHVMGSPKGWAERTTTTTIPLKGGDDSSPVPAKRGRGRPRRSLGSPAKRSGTPKPKVVDRRATLPVSLDHGDDELSGNMVTPTKNRRGRSRKSDASETMELVARSGNAGGIDQAQTPSTVASGVSNTTSRTSRPRSKGRRKAITHMKRMSKQEEDDSPWPILRSRNSIGGLEVVNAQDGSNRITREASLQDELNQDEDTQPADEALQSSAPTPSIVTIQRSPSEDAQILPGNTEKRIRPSHLELTPPHGPLSESDEPMWRGMVKNQGKGIDTENRQEENLTGRLDMERPSQDIGSLHHDPTEEHREFDSVLESEGFSMVTTSSLPSAKQYLSSSILEESETNEDIQLEQSKDILQSLPESNEPPPPSVGATPVQASARHTISTNNPPPPPAPGLHSSPRPLNQPADGTPKLTRIVRAGNALLNALSPNRFNRSSSVAPKQCAESSPCLKSPKRQKSDLFDGFGAGTRRELRAGLRLGEELAKRKQQPSSIANAGTSLHENDVPTVNNPHGSDADNQHTGDISYPSLVSPNGPLRTPVESISDDDDDRMSWTADTLPSKKAAIPSSLYPILSTDTHEQTVDRTMLARHARWEQERQAVSRRIQEANASQVIVIDGDTQAVDGLEDADNSSHNSSQAIFSRSPELSYDTHTTKPRRSKLPSPWQRRTSQKAPATEEEDESDLFWQPISHFADAAAKRKERKKQRHANNTSSSCDDSSAIPHKSTVSREESVLTTDSGIDVSYGKISENLAHNTRQSFTSSEDQSFDPSSSDSELSTKDLEVGQSVEITELDDENSYATIPDVNVELLEPSQSSQEGPPPKKITSQTGETPASSWYNRLTSYLPAVSSTPARAARSAIATEPALQRRTKPSSSPGPEPLSLCTPFTNAHFRALAPMWYESLTSPTLYPFNPATSHSIPLFGKELHNKGWSKALTAQDLGIVDAFMKILNQRGYVPEDVKKEEKKIDEAFVAKMVFGCWCAAVSRGEVHVGEGKTGMNERGEVWTAEDMRPTRHGRRRVWGPGAS